MINILITAIGGGGHGDQILKALRLATSRPYKLFGADANSSCPQASLVDQFTVLPFARDPSYIETLLRVCKQLNIRVLFHGCEPELLLFAEHRKTIENSGIFVPINDVKLIRLCLNKASTNKRLAELGYPAPWYLEAHHLHQLDNVNAFPVIVKPSVGGGGSANVHIAQDKTELKALATYLGLGTFTSNLLIQEYVGRPDQEFTVGVLHDLDGNYINSIAVQRSLSNGLSIRTSTVNRTARKELGPKLVISSGISQGKIGRFEEVTKQCRELAERLGSRGPLNFQCRVVAGKVKVFEINPRFSGTTSLRALVGLNEPDLLITKHVLKQDVPINATYREATIHRSLKETILE